MAVIHDSQGRGIGADNPLAVRQIQSDIVVPVDIQSKYAQTIQTHNAVSVALSGTSDGAWIDSDGFDKIGVTLKNDASSASSIDFHWSHDGVSIHGIDYGQASNSYQYKSFIIDSRSRYFRIRINNSDAALAHTISAWAYLKA